MNKISEIIGLPIVNEKKGEKLGSIRDIIYSKNKFKIMAFLLSEGNLFTNPKIITYKNINFIGEDAVVVKDNLVIEDGNNIPNIKELLEKDLKIVGYEVRTDDGENLGIIHDIIFDNKTGRLLGFIITNGIYEDIKEGRSILPYLKKFTFGIETLIIPRDFKNEFDKNKETFKKLLELE